MNDVSQMRIGRFQLTVLHGGTLRLDGGAMFGVVPRVLWKGKEKPDGDNRILLYCNCLLISDENHHVLVETGMGVNWGKKEREMYQIQTGDIETRLKKIDLDAASITHVINTHLHFDHAGGNMLSQYGQPVPRFPNAKYAVQIAEWKHAMAATAKDRASYRTQDFAALARLGRLSLLEGEEEIIPGVHAVPVGAHSPGMQLVKISDEGQTAIFLADLIPTRHHVAFPWIMSYDCYPLETLSVKEKLIPQLAEENTLVILYHDNRYPLGYVTTGAGGKYIFRPV